MNFEDILQKIVADCGGGLGIALMGHDGIPIVQVMAADTSDNPLGDDLSVAGGEFGRVLGDIHKASDSLGGGFLNEVVVELSRFTLIFREVDEDVMLVLALTPQGNTGKSRYLMRKHLRAIREEL
jgi:predicted regulator of Ras-like GTPase activity (Roadblock/LC7/MglB family)